MKEIEKNITEMKNRRRELLYNEIKNYLLLVIGSICCALAYVFFLIPAKLSGGGVAGLALTFHYVFGVNMGWATFIMNIPLFIIGIKFLGKMYGIRTLIGITLVAFLIDLLDGKYVSFIHLIPPTNIDPIISALFGGLLYGTGLGTLFRGKGSSGGSDIIAQILGKYTSFTPGLAILSIDFFVITFSGIILGTIGMQGGSDPSLNKWELIFYGLITLYTTSRFIDLVLGGVSNNKNVHIISSKKEEILEYIHEMGRGSTILKGVGAYTKQHRDVIFVILSRKELTQLKDYLSSIDDKAFMIIANTHQVLGYGFEKFEKPEEKVVVIKKKNNNR